MLRRPLKWLSWRPYPESGARFRSGELCVSPLSIVGSCSRVVRRLVLESMVEPGSEKKCTALPGLKSFVWFSHG
jgi:hypothetical protein